MILRRFTFNKEGAAAVEFAFALPVVLVFLWGMLAAGIGFWYSNALKEVAFEASRCLAVGGLSCTVPAQDCAQEPKICFIVELARQRGISDLAPRTITINSFDMSSKVASTSVTIAYAYNMLGYSLDLTQTASFPNF